MSQNLKTVLQKVKTVFALFCYLGNAARPPAKQPTHLPAIPTKRQSISRKFLLKNPAKNSIYLSYNIPYCLVEINPQVPEKKMKMWKVNYMQ